jgi:hypothetical protein
MIQIKTTRGTDRVVSRDQLERLRMLMDWQIREEGFCSDSVSAACRIFDGRPDNSRLVRRGMHIVHSDERHKDSNDNLGDVLLDLMHYAEWYGRDFGKALEYASNALSEDTGWPASDKVSDFLDRLAAGGTTNIAEDN